MKTNFEDHIRANREQFDAALPADHVWKSLEEKIKPAAKTATIRSFSWKPWLAAASLLGLILLAAWFFNRPANPSSPTLANNTQDLIQEINPNYAREMHAFTAMIETRQVELKKIEKEQPALYREFMDDISRLDSSYNALKIQLPTNPNREQLLEAMITNLRLQADLLTQQLQVIQKIKNAKKGNDESNFKSL